METLSPTPFQSTVRAGDILWEPRKEDAAATNLARYERWLEAKHGRRFADYPALWTWSVTELDAFWTSLGEFFGVRFHQPADRALGQRAMPGAQWFPGATLNYAEQALRREGIEAEPGPAVLFAGEADAEGRCRREEISRAELARRVAAVAAALRARGVQRGDRVVGYLANTPEALVAFLAAASLGAVWSNCPPELSSRGVLERFHQIEPTVLVAVEAYRYAGREHDRRAVVAEIVEGLPSLRHVVWVEPGEVSRPRMPLRPGVESTSWRAVQPPGAPPPLVFEAVPFDHPLWILYSSGTTGAPKAIVQGHGGIVLEHLKALALHHDLRPGDRFFWYTASGWMMWNFLVSGLLLPGVTVVLYDGSPKYPDLGVLWDFVERNEVTVFGTSAPFLLACLKEGLAPGRQHAFARLRALGSTGAPLPAEGFAWVYERVKRDLWLGSVSGGTDVCTPFVMSHPSLPVRAGEMQCLALGAKIEAWEDVGQAVYGRVGELVLTEPLPSMPVFFWNDPEGRRLRASYFEKFPGVWCHGDWVEIGSPALRCVIHGRSDSTLNRGGVRMGTAEFYAVVESLPEIAEALVIDTGGLGREDRLLLFVALRPGQVLDEALRRRIEQRLRTEVSPRHVPDVVTAVPEIPHTLNGKKLEVPVKRILMGVPWEKAVSREAVANLEALRGFAAWAASAT